MPLPRPFGDPFASKREETSVSTSTPKRVPISASAFSFQLISGKKSGDKGKGKGKEEDVKKEKEWTPLRAKPFTEHTPTSLRKLDPPTFQLKTPKTEAGPSRVATRVTDSPFAQGHGLKRKVEPNDHFQSLGNLEKVDLSEALHVDAIKQRVEEEGIGVSPRGKKIIKYHGRGPPPLSIVLSNALSSQQSSLVLFYASIQNTIYPTRTPKKSRMMTIEKPVTVAQHIKTAPMVLRARRVVGGKTGWSIMCWCEVLEGGGKEKGGKPEIEKQEVAEKEQKEKETREDSEKNLDQRLVVAPMSTPLSLVIFQPVPSECAKLGLDPRIFSLKPPSQSVTYEIGVWGPWTTSTLDLGVAESEGEAEGGGGGVQKVIFASRYLVTEL